MPRNAFDHDILTTIDRYPGSATHGETSAPGVMLWREAGQGVPHGKLTGFLPHGHAVQVIEYRVIEASVFALVKARDAGKNHRGWCNVMFLETAGEEYLRDVLGVTSG